MRRQSGRCRLFVARRSGKWTGFDIDFCRAVSAAVFGDPDKVSFIPLSTKERFTALQSGTVDLLSRQTTWTLSRDAGMGVHFVGTAYYDGQGFMIRKDLGIDSALKLDGASVCTEQGTTTEQNAADYFNANNIKYEPVVIDSADGILKAFETGRCDVYTTDASALYAQRLKLAEPDAFTVLPEVISKEPLGPAVRQGDDKWFNIVRWTLFAMLEAEELGITQASAEADLNSRSRTCAVSSVRKAIAASSSDLSRNGPIISSPRSAIMVKCSSARSARAACSRSTAASMRCGTRAG